MPLLIVREHDIARRLLSTWRRHRIAILGIPLVATYTAIVYWVLRGKVKLDASSY